ncbi:hypothetical protein [Rosistilla oblonga]|uniref:hypothetical protein n=1 Tax=Rosistilla oblonga TaxID=2527990 RepID=UPI003A986ABB
MADTFHKSLLLRRKFQQKGSAGSNIRGAIATAAAREITSAILAIAAQKLSLPKFLPLRFFGGISRQPAGIAIIMRPPVADFPQASALT